MSDQPYKPTSSEGETPKPSFHIGDDGVIHFDKPMPQPSKPDYNPNDDGNDEPPRRRWRKWLWIILILLAIGGAAMYFIAQNYRYGGYNGYNNYQTEDSTVYETQIQAEYYEAAEQTAAAPDTEYGYYDVDSSSYYYEDTTSYYY